MQCWVTFVALLRDDAIGATLRFSQCFFVGWIGTSFRGFNDIRYSVSSNSCQRLHLSTLALVVPTLFIDQGPDSVQRFFVPGHSVRHKD